MPASSYYVLAVAVSTAVFFLIWDVLNNGREDTPWVTAGISASVLLCGAVILREVLLRRAGKRLLRQQRISPGAPVRDTRDANKLTLERNAAILAELEQKSLAAKVLNKFSGAHHEVFELCSEYLALNESELKTISASSPRLAPLLRGRTAVMGYHRFHLLRWAEIEARSLTEESRARHTAVERIEAGQKALDVVESALAFYPAESSLIESRKVLIDLVISIQVADSVGRAEIAASEGSVGRSISLYKEALFYLGRENIGGSDRERAANRINAAIERLRDMESDD